MLSKNQNNRQITPCDGSGRVMFGAALSFLGIFLSTLMLVLLVLAFIFVALLLTSDIAVAQSKDATGTRTFSVAPAVLPQEPPAAVAGYEASSARPLPSAERVGVETSEQTPLTLDEAIRLALDNNNDIETVRADVVAAEFDLKGARGVFDPVFSAESYYERAVTPVATTIGGGPGGRTIGRNFVGNFRFGGLAPFAGGSYQLDFTSTRQNTNDTFATLNPQFPVALTLSYTQPLLRGRRTDDNRRRIQIAAKTLGLTDAQFRERVIDTIARVEAAYWDTVFASRNLKVQLDAVEQARTQVESNRRQVLAGVLAPIDLIAADAQVTTFEQGVYTAQEEVTRAENNLKTLMLRDRTDPLWSRPLVPVTPVDLKMPVMPLEQAVQIALASRPELAQLATSADINRIDTRFLRDRAKPQIDLIAAYTASGLAGSPVVNAADPLAGGISALAARVGELSTRAGLPPLAPVSLGGDITPNLVGGYGQSLSNLFAARYPTFRVGVRIELPFRNRTAQANLGRALVEGTRLDARRRQTEQLIEAEVRNSLQTIRSTHARLRAAAATRLSTEQQYASERRQLDAGTSTVFIVLERQQSLVEARGRELQAQTDLNKASAALRRATGSTLDAAGVALRADSRASGTGGLLLSTRGSGMMRKASPLLPSIFGDAHGEPSPRPFSLSLGDPR